MDLKWSFLVVNNGNPLDRSNLICHPKIDLVPVPVLSSFWTPFLITFSRRLIYCFKKIAPYIIIKFIKDKKIIKPILIGHSLGALITIQIAGQNPKLLKSGIAVSPIFNRSKLALKKVQARAKELELNTAKKNIAKGIGSF